jgi:hypothetical protein
VASAKKAQHVGDEKVAFDLVVRAWFHRFSPRQLLHRRIEHTKGRLQSCDAKKERRLSAAGKKDLEVACPAAPEEEARVLCRHYRQRASRTVFGHLTTRGQSHQAKTLSPRSAAEAY